MSSLDVDDPDTLATQLSLLVDGAYAAALIRKDPHTMQSAIAAARTLLKAAGAQLSVVVDLQMQRHSVFLRDLCRIKMVRHVVEHQQELIIASYP